MKEAAKKYIKAGVLVHPTKEDKSPMFSGWQNGFEPETFEGAHGIGLVCGKKSGGLECIDFDNHFGDAKQRISDYLKLPEVLAIFQKYKLPLEESKRGGYHLLYRCDTVASNQKLAMRKNADGKGEALIETRGEGGFFVADPTPGYKTIRNNIYVIPKISVIDRAVLLDTAKAYNEYIKLDKVERKEHEGDERPGDIYNRSIGVTDATKSLLRKHGWTNSGKMWRRPGKKEGFSATFGAVGENIFYNFSSNGDPFEPDTAYTPFQVLALLEYNGDFSECAKMLAREQQVDNPRNEFQPKPLPVPQLELEKELMAAMIDITKEIPEPPAIINIKQKGFEYPVRPLFTLGNFSVVNGKAKSKKTFLLSMIISSLLGGERYDNKFESRLKYLEKKNVLWFDTEQAEYHAHKTVKRMSKAGADLFNLRAFKLRPYSPMERCSLIETALKAWGNNTCLMVIDGIADLGIALNDEEDATRVVGLLMRWSHDYGLHIVTVLHQNKMNEFVGGHLGSYVMKKAELLISVSKSQTQADTTDVRCDMSRGLDFDPFSFKIVDGLPALTDFIGGAKEKDIFNETEPVF